MRALLERELADILATVGPISYGDTQSVDLPVDVILTDAADRAAATAALLADVGANTTGFAPERTGDRISVTFTATVVHVTRLV